jgi:hypothetical protein
MKLAFLFGVNEDKLVPLSLLDSFCASFKTGVLEQFVAELEEDEDKVDGDIENEFIDDLFCPPGMTIGMASTSAFESKCLKNILGGDCCCFECDEFVRELTELTLDDDLDESDCCC